MELLTRGVVVLSKVEDRPLRVGMKFKHTELLWLPRQVAAGRRAQAQRVELVARSGGEKADVSAGESVALICDVLGKLRRRGEER